MHHPQDRPKELPEEFPYRDRAHAGQLLAGRLRHYAGRADVVVLALPRGGVPVAHEVARALRAPLDVFLVRKLGVPGHEELAMGAIASGGVRVINDAALAGLEIDEATIDAVTRREQDELDRREQRYRQGRPPPDVAGKVVVLIDDGLATGATMRAAVAALRRQGPDRIVVAVPTAARPTRDQLAAEVDEIVAAATPSPFRAVGLSYLDFSQATDDEVGGLLEASWAMEPAGTEESTAGNGDMGPAPEVDQVHSELTIPLAGVAAGVALQAGLVVPRQARGVVLFAHGSGSSRHSPRNRQVARALQQAGLATLLADLLTAEEEQVDVRTRHLRFDIGLLADRLAVLADWLAADERTAGLPLGLFGASTGAGAALVAAARRPATVAAVVSRGGRPDLAGPALDSVRAPTLLIVGSLDAEVLELNRQALDRLAHLDEAGVGRRLEVVPGAGHLFEEPGALDRVALLARSWFERHLAGTVPA
ncbi:MAG TPA: phosphoribosyltransferase family protein [Acidimicrobiales bacterium]|nr:phosphoribosyltransferase family protein [Acidimicrobiales bacterium]